MRALEHYTATKKLRMRKLGMKKKSSTYEVNLKHNSIVRATRDTIETLSQNNKEKNKNHPNKSPQYNVII